MEEAAAETDEFDLEADGAATDHVVDHIDIGIRASASVKVPLAYGDYYDENGNLVVSVPFRENYDATGVNTAVDITQDDLVAATITAKDSSGTVSYTRSGRYSTSTGTDPYTGTTINQVRIGGSFPVGNFTDQVEYTVSVSKPVDLVLTYDGKELYDVDNNKLQVTVNAVLSASFHYWDEENSCPGIENRNSWRNGTFYRSAGMDFVLGTTDEKDVTLEAVEIVKNVVDENGNLIKLDDPVTFDFTIYQNPNGDVTAPTAWSGETDEVVDYSGYTEAGERSISVGSSGMAIAYEYNVTNGLTYIVEDEPPATITDADGNTLNYAGTYIKTEYAWRNDDGETHSNVNQKDKLKAIPDVVGDYYSTTTDDSLHNTFLEFYVYNIYKPDTTEVTVTKVWDDADDQDGIRPGSVSVQLKANGENSGSAVSLNEDNEWTYTWEELSLYDADGEEIDYTVAEVEVEGYDAALTGDAENGFTITNTHTPEKTEVSGAKTWNDADNQDGKRPASITINLLADGEKVDSKTVTEADGWKWSFTGLAKYKDGKEITYTITEDAVADYTAAVSGYDVENTHETEKTEVSGAKTWNDADNQDGKRPASITINLLADGEKVDSKTVTEADGWKWSFTGLDKYKDGKEITYTITEDAVADYTAAVSGYDVENTHEPEKTEVSGAKTWNDADNQDGKRPASITINLLADGEKVDSKTVTEADGWKWSFTGLDKYKDGKEITYTITEDAVADYTAAVSGYNVENTHETEKTEVSVTKVWDDADDQDGKRTDSITVKLSANDSEVESVELNTNNDWSYTWKELDKYAAGEEIDYTISEVKVDGYEVKTTGDAENGFTITNSYTPETTEITAIKVWDDADDQDGKRPTSITINLLADGKKVDSAKVTEKDGWTHTFADLAKYSGGKEIVYTVTEEAVSEYSTTIAGFTITNSYTPGKTSVTVTKAWDDADDQDGKRPDSVEVTLLADGKTAEAKDAVVKLNEANKWTYTWSGLSEKANGKAIAYTVKEAEVADYTVKVTGDAKTGYTVTNTYTPETTEVSGAKTWEDNDDQDGKRPASITINLLADGKKVDSVTVTEKDGWKWTFSDIAKYADGKEITYTITEDEVTDYTAEVSGYDVTNTHEPETMDIAVTKVWDDQNDKDGKRPDSVTVKLLANGIETGDVVTLTEANGWKGSFTDLDKYEDGEEIAYTVEETEVKDYTVKVTGDAENGFTVTNKHTPETPENPPKTPTKNPEKKPPATGDRSMIGLWVTMMVLTAGAAAWLGMFSRKRRKDNGC